MSTTVSTALTATVDWTSGDLTVTSAGSISGADGILATGTLGNLSNGGSLQGATFRGIVNQGDIATATNNGTISDGYGFVNGLSATQTGNVDILTNNGAISSQTDGIVNMAGSTIGVLLNNSSITSQATAILNGGTITSLINSGTITGRLANTGYIGSLDNAGTLTNGLSEGSGAQTGIAKFVNSGSVGGDLDFSYDTLASITQVDSGSITGRILMSPNTDTLTIQGAGLVSGDIVASAGGKDVVNLDPGAGKTYTAQGHFGAQGGLALTAVTIDSGAFWIDLAYFNITTVNFAGAGTTLALADKISTLQLTSFTPTITGFGGGDTLYLVDTAANAASLNANGQLVLTENGATVGTFTVTGNYTGASFQAAAHGNGTYLTVIYTAANAVNNAASLGGAVQVTDNAQNVQTSLDGLESLAATGKLTGITLTDANTPTIGITAAQLASDAKALQDISGTYTLKVSGIATADSLSVSLETHILPVSVTDSAANISKDIDALQSYAAAGKLTGITLTDSGFGTIALSSTQLSADGAALNDISGSFVVSVAATAANQTISGYAGHGTTVVFSGTASEYSITTSGSQVIVTDTGTGRTSVDHLSGITAIQFADQTDIAAQTPGASSVTAGNVTELYAAVFGRLPDVPGLNYYEAMLAANPAMPLTQLAQSFLASPEYTNNTSHAYTADTAGDTKFITDMYQNLLGRAPESGAVPYYLDLIAKLTQGVAPGTPTYAAADTLAHAYLLTDISASAEFLNDVTVTGQNPSSAKHWLILTN